MKHSDQAPGLVLLVILSSMAIAILSACLPGVQPATPQPVVIETFQDVQGIFKEIRNAPATQAQARAEELWQTLVDSTRVPLVFRTQVIFLYKGPAEAVAWRGSFNGWGAPGLEGTPIGETDLWVAYVDLPEASRIEYKIVLNGKDWLVDPANPNRAFSGLTGDNNVLTLPGFQVSDESENRSDVKQGTLEEDLSIASKALGYTVHYWVYTPAGYEKLEQLPVLYLLDGNDFVDERMGAMPNVLDNLIGSGRIQPVLVVFVDAREPENPKHNRREEEFLAHPVEHAQFIADELVPLIDHTYRTDPRPEARLIAGVSFGGLSASYIAASRSETFHHLAAFSPAFWLLNSPQHLSDPQQKEGSRQMLPAIDAATECGGETGFRCPRLPLKVFITAGIASWDVGDLRSLVATLEEQGYPVAFHQVREGHTWAHWRGLSDEMLEYFFGVEGAPPG